MKAIVCRGDQGITCSPETLRSYQIAPRACIDSVPRPTTRCLLLLVLGWLRMRKALQRIHNSSVIVYLVYNIH